jgi:hypothetical protein
MNSSSYNCFEKFPRLVFKTEEVLMHILGNGRALTDGSRAASCTTFLYKTELYDIVGSSPANYREVPGWNLGPKSGCADFPWFPSAPPAQRRWYTSKQATIISFRYVIRVRSQWPRGLRHEMSSPAWTLGSWARIPLDAWMFVCVYSLFVFSCVGSGLATGWSLVQGVLPIVYKCKIKEPYKEEAKGRYGLQRHWKKKTFVIFLSLNAI